MIQGDDCRPRRRSRPRSPLLNPIRRSSESRGLCCRSCFGPRTCVRGRTNIQKRFGALNQGFPFSLLQCRQGRTRMGWVGVLEGMCMLPAVIVLGLALGDLAAWRHSARASRGPLSVLLETYDGPAWRLISTLCGESANRSFVRCSSIQVPELYQTQTHTRELLSLLLLDPPKTYDGAGGRGGGSGAG